MKKRFSTLNTEQIKADIMEMESEEEIQDYLEQLWLEAKNTSDNLNRLTHMFQFSDDMTSDEVIKIQEENINGEEEHK